MAGILVLVYSGCNLLGEGGRISKNSLNPAPLNTTKTCPSRARKSCNMVGLVRINRVQENRIAHSHNKETEGIV